MKIGGLKKWISDIKDEMGGLKKWCAIFGKGEKTILSMKN